MKMNRYTLWISLTRRAPLFLPSAFLASFRSASPPSSESISASESGFVVVGGGGNGGAEIGNPIGDEAEVAEAAPGEALVRPSALRRSSE